MKHVRKHRLFRNVGVAGLFVVSSALLAACGGGSGANALGQQACRDVGKSITSYQAANSATTPKIAAADRAKALSILRAALQPAAIAGSEDGSWQALMATLSESSRVSENLLVPALQAQCNLS